MKKTGKTLISILAILTAIIIIYITQQKSNKEAQKETTIENTKTSENMKLETDKNIEIKEGGTYKITGESENSNITIDTEEEITLILDNVNLTNKTGPAITIENSKQTTLTILNNNKLTDGSNTNTDYDAVIYSKDDLIINGEGTLEITTTFENGIKCTDNLTLDSNITVNSKTNGIIGKDSITIKSGNINITSEKDGIKTNNEEGKISIDQSNINITSKEDGIKSQNITINSGTINIKSEDDAIHANEKIEINNGILDITAHEGLEATYIKINNGTINIEAKDDGINAGKKIENTTPTIEINGGTINIKMQEGDTDAIDSNGNLYINGGTINITAQSPFDYDKEGIYKGGTIIINGKETNELTNQFMNPGMQESRMDKNQKEQQPPRENQQRMR